ncbi:hypothetical protein F5Y19DRAFT_415829 [Xylariaceae sp. FL1651]|nr:hypothetical protein F5Y19DRAFT_415829 [Xylariaceae sp. FL1651]
MAIGSALTIAVFLAWQFYGYLQFKKKVEPFEIFPYIKDHMRRYDTLLKEAEERGYGPESIRGVVVERALALAFALEMCTEDPVRQRPRELGPLPRFHKSMPYYGMEKIEDQETLVLLNPVPAITRPLPQVNAPSNGRKPADTERLHEILITVNVSGEDLERTADEKSSTPKEAGAIDPTRSMWDEVRWRSGMVIDKLYAIGMFEKDKRVMVIIMARDDLRAYTYSDGCFERIIIDEPHTSGVSR